MTAPTLPGRHQMEMTDLHLAPAAARLSTRGWAALRRSATVLVFVLATVVGVSTGIRGVEISPVAPAVTVAAAASAVPAPVGPDTVTLAAAPPGPGQRPDGNQGGRGRGRWRWQPMKRDRFARRFVTGLGIGAIGAAALALVRAPWPLPLNAALLAHVTGLLAGYLVAVMVLLMSRMPVLDRRIGSDTLARWHGKGGRLFLSLLLVHAGAAVQSWADARRQGILPSVLDVLGLQGLAGATLGTAVFVTIAVISIRAARRKLSYETWHGVHLLTYIAIALSFDHELAGPNLAGIHSVQIIWTLLYAWAFASVLRYRILSPLGNLWRHRLCVEAVIPEAEGVASIILRGRHLTELRAEPGQFFRWRFLTTRTWRSAHPFSLSAPPLDDRMRITVKALGTGSTLLHSLRPGTMVFAEGPSGSMTARKRTEPSVLLIAGGVGITPMRALFETLEHRGGRMTLLYRASSTQDIIFEQELRYIARTRGAEIIWMIGRSADPANQLTAGNLQRLVPDLAERDVYLCASPALSAAVRKGLRQAGLPAYRLHEEVFDF